MRRSSRPWSYAARYQRPECTTRPCGLTSRVVSSPANARVAEAEAQPPSDRLGDEERDVALYRRALTLGRREPERRLERLDLAPERVRQHPVELRERAVDRALAGLRGPADGRRAARARRRPPRRRRASAAAGGSRVGRGSRRRRRAGPRPGCRGPAAPRCSAAPCARRSRAARRSRGPSSAGASWSSSSSSSSRAVGVCMRRSQAHIEGEIRPICDARSSSRRSRPRRRDERDGAGRLDREGLRLLDGELERPEQAGCASGWRARTSGTSSTRTSSGLADPRRHWERGRLPHRLPRRLRGDVVPLLRPRDEAMVDLLGRQPPAGPARSARDRRVRRTTRASSRATTRSRAGRSASGSPGPASTRRRPRWEQAFSEDGGKTWETNWIADFTRVGGRGMTLLAAQRRGRPRVPARRRSTRPGVEHRARGGRAQVVRHRAAR